MLFVVYLALAMLAVPAVISCLYLLGLTLTSAPLPVPARSMRQIRFDIVVPAHNEAGGIESTLCSLHRIDWASDRVRLYVVADNCTDHTAELAEAAGARVLIRTNEQLRGKGYALAYAFEQCIEEGWSDAIVVVDADSDVSPNLLEAFASRLEQGEQAIQAHYGIRNPMNSWRTRLVTVAMGAFHIVRSRGRERLGVSSGIRGNGWCVAVELLNRVPYRAFSLTEDLEYGIMLGLAGQRVAFAEEASANADMVSSSAIARRQRQRWEGGRMDTMRRYAMPALRAAWCDRSAIKLDLALDLLVLPLSYVALNVGGLVVLASTAVAFHVPFGGFFLATAATCLAALVLHVLRGWSVSGTGWRGLTALAHVPFYILWKIVVMLGSKTSEWVRTERETA